MKITKQRHHHGKRHKMLSALALISFFSLATLIVAVDNLQAQLAIGGQSTSRFNDNQRSDLERFDALGHPLGKKSSYVDYEVLTDSELGGFNYTYRQGWYRYTTSFNSSANSLGLRYSAIIGAELPLRDYLPYMFNYQNWWGLGLGLAWKNYIKTDIFYVRFRFSSVNDGYDRNLLFGIRANLGFFDELFTRNVHVNGSAVDELFAGRVSFNTKEMPLLNLIRVPGEAGIAELNRVDIMGFIARTVNYEAGVQNTLEGISNDISSPKRSWKIKVTSPFEVHPNATYKSNYAAKVYGVKLTVRLTNELTNRFYISNDPNANNVIVSRGGVAGVSGNFHEVHPGNFIEYEIQLRNIPNIDVTGDISTIHLDKAELEIEIENNYIIQIASSGGGGFRSYENLSADGNSYPQDVVAVNNKRIGDGSNKKRIKIPLGETSSKRNYGVRILGRLLTIDYDYSLIVQEVYRRINTTSQNTPFFKQQSFVQTLDLSKSFLDETLLLTYNYHKIDPMYSHLWNDNQLIVDDDDQDGILNESFELPRASDLNQNGILDWREDFIIKNSSPQVFSSDSDVDHNFIEDQEQDDELPDTPYGFNTEGHSFSALYRVPRIDLILTGGYSGSQRLSTGQVNNDTYIAATYDTKKDRGTILGRFKFKNSTHWIKDEIWNPVKDSKVSLTGSSTETRVDHLLFRDSIRNRIIFSQVKKFSKYFGIENNFSVDQNFAFHKETNIYTRSFLLSKVNIDLPIINRVVDWNNNLIFVKEIDSNTNDPKGIFNKDNNKLYLLSFFNLFEAKSGKEGIKIGAQYQRSFSIVDETRNFEETSYIMQIRLANSSGHSYIGVIRYREKRLLYDLPINVKERSNSFSFRVNVYR